MLSLTRSVGGRLYVDIPGGMPTTTRVCITLLQVRGSKSARIGLEGPDYVTFLREEIDGETDDREDENR
jgi:sRNA-binding carbon storage regulator CsrA